MPRPDSWQPPTVFLTGISAVSATDAWAVGTGGGTPSAPATVPITLHWNGSTWTYIPTPATTTTDNYLFAVSADAPKDTWIVGQRSPGVADPVWVLHWNGTTWSTK